MTIAELAQEAARKQMHANELLAREFARSLGVEADGDGNAIMDEVQRRVRLRWGETAQLVLLVLPDHTTALAVQEAPVLEGEKPVLLWVGSLTRIVLEPPPMPPDAARKAIDLLKSLMPPRQP
jgi:hypothetical protein